MVCVSVGVRYRGTDRFGMHCENALESRTSLCLRDAAGVRLGHVLEVVEKVVRQVASSLDVWEGEMNIGSSWKTFHTIPESVGDRVTVVVRGM